MKKRHMSSPGGVSVKEIVKDVQDAIQTSDSVEISTGKKANHAHAIKAALVGRLSPAWVVHIRYSAGRSRVVITRKEKK